MFRAILVRHGEKQTGEGDDKASLSSKGVQQARRVGEFLKSLSLGAELILTSRFAHARETAEELARNLGVTRIIEAAPLTPNTKSDFSIEALVAEAADKGCPLPDHGVILLVGHEPRLTQVSTMMTSQRFPPLDRLEFLCIEAQDLRELRLGRGEVQWRCILRELEQSPRPTVDTSKNDLRDKLIGKMTVAALLAGFTFTALLELVKEDNGLHLEKMPGWGEWGAFVNPEAAPVLFGIMAVVCLTLSFAIFLAAVYVYDRLSMPENFLEYSPIRSTISKYSKGYSAREERFGFVYASMIHAWQWIFTPAVWFAVLGFLCIVARQSMFMATMLLGVVILARVYYKMVRPKYSVD